MKVPARIQKLARVALDHPELRGDIVPIIEQWKTAQGEQPKTTDIYPTAMNHGWDEPLSGGTDVMRRVQNDFRHEQGLPTRPSSPEVPKVAAKKGDKRSPVETDIRHPYYDMGDQMGSLEDALKGDPKVSKDRAVMKAFSDLRKADKDLYKELTARYLWD